MAEFTAAEAAAAGGVTALDDGDIVDFGTYKKEKYTTKNGVATLRDPRSAAAQTQEAQDAQIAALQTAVSDPQNATQAELDAVAALVAGKVDQTVYDAYIAGNATDAEVAAIQAVLQGQIDTLNTEQTTQDNMVALKADTVDLTAETTRATTVESALQAALDTQEAKQDAHEQSRARPHLPAGGTVGQQPEIAADNSIVWADKISAKLRIEITSGLVLEPGNSYVTYGNPYTLPPAGPLGEEIDVLHDVPVKGNAAAVVSGANTKRLVSGASLPPLPIQPGNRILYVSDGTDWAVSVCLLYTSPSPRDQRGSRMPSSA